MADLTKLVEKLTGWIRLSDYGPETGSMEQLAYPLIVEARDAIRAALRDGGTEVEVLGVALNTMGSAISVCCNELEAAGHHALAGRLEDARGAALGLLTRAGFHERLSQQASREAGQPPSAASEAQNFDTPIAEAIYRASLPLNDHDDPNADTLLSLVFSTAATVCDYERRRLASSPQPQSEDTP